MQQVRILSVVENKNLYFSLMELRDNMFVDSNTREPCEACEAEK